MTFTTNFVQMCLFSIMLVNFVYVVTWDYSYDWNNISHSNDKVDFRENYESMLDVWINLEYNTV